jgi:hypothetical protein
MYTGPLCLAQHLEIWSRAKVELTIWNLALGRKKHEKHRGGQQTRLVESKTKMGLCCQFQHHFPQLVRSNGETASKIVFVKAQCLYFILDNSIDIGLTERK